MMDKRWIKRESAGDAPRNQAVRDISRRALKNAAARQTHLFASSALKRRAARNAVWDHLNSFPIREAHLAAHQIVSATRPDRTHMAFDDLRDRLLRLVRENGWKRVAITAPTLRKGKTFTAVNLLMSLSRAPDHRAVLLDLDLRRPKVASTLGIANPGPLGEFLRGDTQARQHVRRAGQNLLGIGDNIAVAANGVRERSSVALIQSPQTRDAIAQMEQELQPDIVICDLPPALGQDEVSAALPLLDGVLVVVGDGPTRADDLRRVEQHLGEDTPLLGFLLNTSDAGPGTPHQT